MSFYLHIIDYQGLFWRECGFLSVVERAFPIRRSTTLNKQKSSIQASLSAPKLDAFYKLKEKWNLYYQRFMRHPDIYKVISDDKRRACLLSWIGAETYSLLENIFDDEIISLKSFKDLTERLSAHFKDTVHVQAARYAFYNCKTQPDQSYSDWVNSLRGMARNCRFTCKSERCNHASYVDKQIRDVIT